MRGCKKRRNGLSEEAAGCRGCTRDASEARSGPDGGTLVGGPRPGCKHTCIFVLDNLLCPSLKRPFLSFFLSLCNWNEVITLKNGEQWGNDSNAEWTEVKLFWENEMNFSPLSLQEYIFHFYNELVVSIVSKFKQRAKQKNSGGGVLMLFVLLLLTD